MKNFKVWLLLALVFVAGAAGGVVTTRVATRRFVQRAIADPAIIRARIERDLDRKLGLVPRQRQQMHQILRDSHEHLKTLRQEFQPRFAAIMQETRQNISEILTPDQQKQFEQFLEANRPFLPLREPMRLPPRTN